MNKYKIILMGICIIFVLGCRTYINPALQQPTQETINLYVSVKDFGAKGDGITDDSKAIKSAVDYAVKSGYSANRVSDLNLKHIVYFGTFWKIYFPPGIYRISSPIEIGSYLRFESDKATLIPTSNFAKTGIAIKSTCWQCSIKGLQFIGFSRAIDINNNNLDVGKIVIEDCDFQSNAECIRISAGSSISDITGNRFFNNDLVLNIVAGEKVIFDKNWITSGELKGEYGCQIINNGMLHFDKNILVPSPPDKAAIEPAWINNYNSVTVNDTRQGGEQGSFTLVNNFAEADITYPVWPRSVIIRDSECYAVYGHDYTKGREYYQPAALRLINIPNQIILENLRGFVDAKVLDFSREKRSQKGLNFNLLDKNVLNFEIRNIYGAPFKHKNNSDIPEDIQKYLDRRKLNHN